MQAAGHHGHKSTIFILIAPFLSFQYLVDRMIAIC